MSFNKMYSFTLVRAFFYFVAHPQFFLFFLIQNHAKQVLMKRGLLLESALVDCSSDRVTTLFTISYPHSVTSKWLLNFSCIFFNYLFFVVLDGRVIFYVYTILCMPDNTFNAVWIFPLLTLWRYFNILWCMSEAL